MVIGYHIIFGVYGFWLPNDPRGSWSDFVGSWEIFCFGKATKTDTRKSVANVSHDQKLRQQAKASLKFPPVELSDEQVSAIGKGFQQACEEGHYSVSACSILSKHVHLVINRHERAIGRIVGHIKARATQQLKAENLWPNADQPVWSKRSWKVFVDNNEQMLRVISYVEKNPVHERKPHQHWSFVVPYVEQKTI